MELSNAKGTRDYMPEDMIILQEIMQSLQESFEKYGFNPVSTPVIEKMDVLSAKYAGGAEILKETFQFQDQGERNLGLRYDLTVPFARIVGMNPTLKLPFKRYQMEKVYRDGPVGPGRYREFYQCDIDVVGPKSMKAEAELLEIVKSFFAKYELDCVINVNNVKVLKELFSTFNAKDVTRVMLTVDKWEKIGPEEVLKELIANGENEKSMKELVEFFSNVKEKSFADIKDIISDKSGVEELEELFLLCDGLRFNPLLARGLSYYTGTIIEVTLKDNAITSTVSAGGRYDSMIGNLLDSKEAYPAVGLTFGLSRIYDALVSAGKIKQKKTVTEVFVYGINQDKAVLDTAKTLREAGFSVETDLMNRKPSKNQKYAESLGIPNVIVIGENEVANKTVSVKTSKGFSEISLDEAIKQLGK